MTRNGLTKPPRRGRGRPRRPVFSGWITAIAVVLMLAVWGGVAAQEPTTTGPEPPEECVFPSELGEVVFPHRMHAEDFEIECVSCHHEVNARKLNSPHEEYFQDFWIRCNECHHDSDAAAPARKCSMCHHRSQDIADQPLSAKVVVHRVCSECHTIGTGPEASASCAVCHTGPRQPW